jgi:hypothetical protein
VLLEDKNEHSIDYKDVPQFIKRFVQSFTKTSPPLDKLQILQHRFHKIPVRLAPLELPLPEIIALQRSSLHEDYRLHNDWRSTVTLCQDPWQFLFLLQIMYKRLPEIIERIKNNKMSTSDDLRVPSMLEQIAVMIYNDPNCLTVQNCIDHLMTLMATVSQFWINLFNQVILCVAGSRHLQYHRSVYLHDVGSAPWYTSKFDTNVLYLLNWLHRQNLAVKELRDVVGDKKSLDMDDVSKLKYLEMCIKETLRLFPVAPFVLRETTEDFQLGEDLDLLTAVKTFSF